MADAQRWLKPESPHVRERFGLGRFSERQLAVLWVILSAGFLLRILALDWGLPPSGPERAAAGLRSSYAMDESEVLEALSRTDPGAGNFDPGLYRWGTLHLTLTLVALEAAEGAGFIGEPWREAWRGMHRGSFERVYAAGRALSVLVDLGSVLLAALIALRIGGAEAALWSAALVALSPGHLVQAGQIRVDVTATACLLLLCLTILSERPPWLIAFCAGLAVAAKYAVAPLALAALAVESFYRGQTLKRLAAIAAGGALGFVVGEPWILTDAGEVMRQAGGAISSPSLAGLVESLLGMARFSLGVPAAGLAAVGFVLLWRRGRIEGRLLGAVMGTGLLALIQQDEALLRHHLPLVPIAAITASVAIVAAGRWSKPLGATALFVAGTASFEAVSYRIAPHPANLALQVLERAAAPGGAISRIAPGLPPLDPARYPEGPNPLTDDLRANPPDWVVLSGLPGVAYPEDNLAFLREAYERTAVFRGHSRSSWATLGERGAPEDWRYSHPALTIYRRR